MHVSKKILFNQSVIFESIKIGINPHTHTYTHKKHTLLRVCYSLFWRLTNAMAVVYMLTTRNYGWRWSMVDLQRIAERAGDSSFIGPPTSSRCNKHCYTEVEAMPQTQLYSYVVLQYTYYRASSAFFMTSTLATYRNENSNKSWIFFFNLETTAHSEPVTQ